MKKTRRAAPAKKATGDRNDDAEMEALMLDLVQFGRRRDQSEGYARILERLLVDKGLVREDVLETVMAEAHAAAAVQTALNPIFDEVTESIRQEIRQQKRGRS